MSTDSTDICGSTETTSGEPCQNKAGSCPWHEGDEKPDTGRPTLFNDERAQKAIKAAQNGQSKAGCERACGVGNGTINTWLDKNPTFTDKDGEEQNFFQAFRRARNEGENKLIKNGLYDPETDSSMAKFLLSSSFDYVKTEKQEVTGEGGGGIVIDLGDDE